MHTIKEGGVEYKKHEVTLLQTIIDKINFRFQWFNGLAHGGPENIPQHMKPPEQMPNSNILISCDIY